MNEESVQLSVEFSVTKAETAGVSFALLIVIVVATKFIGDEHHPGVGV